MKYLYLVGSNVLLLSAESKNDTPSIVAILPTSMSVAKGDNGLVLIGTSSQIFDNKVFEVSFLPAEIAGDLCNPAIKTESLDEFILGLLTYYFNTNMAGQATIDTSDFQLKSTLTDDLLAAKFVQEEGQTVVDLKRDIDQRATTEKVANAFDILIKSNAFVSHQKDALEAAKAYILS